MASADTLLSFLPADNEPPSASYATLDIRNGHPVLDFDAAADEIAIFSGVLPRNYAGGGITIKLHLMATSATSGTSRWLTAIERMDTGTDLDADSFATANSAGVASTGTAGAPFNLDIVHTSGAQMDSLAAGDPFRLKVTRDADGTSGTDDMAGDAELVAVEIRET